MSFSEKQSLLTTLGGLITCKRCQATSKRTKQQCMAPAVKNKNVCRFHGAYSTGPKTPDGKRRASAPHTTFGHETRLMRKKRSIKLRELKLIEQDLKSKGLI